MASVVIVSSQCYLLAEAINYMVINEDDDSNDREWRPNKRTRGRRARPITNAEHAQYIKQRKPYHIVINFIPKGQPNTSTNSSMTKATSRDDTTSVSIRVHGLDNAIHLFQDIVGQLREQIPDELWLNKLVEKFLMDVEE